MRLKGKRAVITGAAQGIGFACAKLFAQSGAKVLVADIDADKGAAAAETIAKDPGVAEAGGEAAFRATDVGDKAQASALIEDAVEIFGGLDIAINNAGII